MSERVGLVPGEAPADQMLGWCGKMLVGQGL